MMRHRDVMCMSRILGLHSDVTSERQAGPNTGEDLDDWAECHDDAVVYFEHVRVLPCPPKDLYAAKIVLKDWGWCRLTEATTRCSLGFGVQPFRSLRGGAKDLAEAGGVPDCPLGNSRNQED